MSGVATVRPWLVSVGETYWKSMSTAPTPAGTAIWKAETSRSSRTQTSSRPPALARNPVTLRMSPRGLWPPGIHLG